MEQPGSASGTEQEHETQQTPDADQSSDAEQTPDDRPRRGPGRSASDDGPQAFTATAKLGAGIAVIGIVGTGMLDFALSQYGSPAAGRAVWAVGFTLTVFVLWYVILRPMEITGP